MHKAAAAGPCLLELMNIGELHSKGAIYLCRRRGQMHEGMNESYGLIRCVGHVSLTT